MITPTAKNGRVRADLNMNKKNIRKYRFAPLFLAAFIRTFFAAIYGLALPNNYVFGDDVSAGFVGLISFIPAITYIAGPFLGRYITNKTKSSKTTILISSIFSMLMMILVVVFVSSSNLIVIILVIIFRSLEGLSNGMFWPEMFNYITTWEQSPPTQNGKRRDYLKLFNYSWNFGLISGFLAGYVLVELIGSDFIALIIAVGIACLSLLNLIFFESNEKYHLHEDRAVVVQNFKLLPQNRKEYEHPEKAPYTTESSDTSLYKVPLIMGLGGILFFASTKSILRFTLPFYLDDIFTIESQWVYLIVLGQQALQIVGLQIIRKFKKMRIGYWMGVVVLLISITILLFVSSSFEVLVIINIVTGFFFGLIHGVAQRIILDKGKHYNSKKYTMLSEAFIGLAFGVPPIAAGFLYEVELIYVFIFQIALLTVLTAILLVNHFKYVKKENLGIFKK